MLEKLLEIREELYKTQSSKNDKHALGYLDECIKWLNKKECSHYYENDNSAFYYNGHDSHHRYYKCKLCGFEKEI